MKATYVSETTTQIRERTPREKLHLCLFLTSELPDGIRGLYRMLDAMPTSEIADKALIRSHIAYHAGFRDAERASIRPSRGHWYRVALRGEHGPNDIRVRVTDPFDHRNGVEGLTKAFYPN